MSGFQIDFKNKWILVTGASSGIGFATAKLLSECNARVVAISRQEEKLKTAITHFKNPEQHRHYVIDLDTDYETLPALLKKIALECGPLSGIFHCAGIESIRPIQILSNKSLDEMLNITLKSALFLAKGFCQKGVSELDSQTSIVFMSSVAAVTGQKGMSVYSAARAGLEGAVRSLATELAPRIRVNAVMAGAIETPMHTRLTANLPEESINDYREKHLLGFGTPEDVANASVFLLSDLSKWITGTSMVIDGGYIC